jgi:CRP-like cAMP-binding protein
MDIERRLHNLKTVIGKLSDIPGNEWEYFSRELSQRNFDTEEFLIRAGEPVTEFFFIVEGLVRFFYLTREGKEFNKFFAMENDFVGSFSYKIRNEPCPFSAQALENTETLVLPIKILEEAYKSHSAWERVGRLYAEKIALIKELREKEFLLDPAETRYRRFMNEYPSLARRIPQYHIASYLGITDVALSRIRKKFKK